MARICSIVGCSNPHDAKGFCRTHYRRWRRHGDPMITTKPANGELMRWISRHLNYNGERCLIWPFARCSRSGSAQMTINRKTVNPARVICGMLYGQAPSLKHEAAHSCGNGHEGCVHPQHVRWATHRENEADKRLHGTAPQGERHGSAKLTSQQVHQIRLSKESCSIAGKRYGVSFSMIARIRRREAWSHIP